MIVKMQKITLICQQTDRREALDRLAALGVLHIVPVVEPAGPSVDELTAAIAETRRALDLVPAPVTDSDRPPETRAPADVVREALDARQAGQQAAQTAAALRAELQRLADFGDFDPAAFAALAAEGITIKLARYPRKHPPTLPDGVQTHVLRATGKELAVALIGTVDFTIDGAIPLPDRAITELRTALEEAEQRVTTEQQRLADLAAYRAAIAQHLQTLQDALDTANVAAGMGAAESLAYLRGFCPVDEAPRLRQAARDSGWGLLVEPPNADDKVPTLIRHPAWVKPIKAVFDMIGLIPDYREIDISVAFLLFFSLFFAILIGDAGYGAVFLLLTLAARRKWPQAPRYPFALLGILSCGTIVWGILTGVYFGTSPGQLPAPLQRLTLGWLADPAQAEHNLILLCFLIGAVHLTVAHAWNTVRIINSTKALAQLGWIALTWTMFFTARTMILGGDFPRVAWILLWTGLGLVALFMTKPREFKADWANHVMLPLNVVSNFVDVVSYVRLFAVGSASLAVAAAFNEMALAGGVNSIGAGLGAALILFLGHTLNILLGAMGILVHGVRLNTLEFSGHVGMQWTGIPYLPFARRMASPGANATHSEPVTEQPTGDST
jgi:V/A-type H+/Na+-transporting ATPase subunit I